MASSSSVPIVDLPIGIEGVCMICKVKPSVKEILLCALCATPWHSAHLLLSTLPQTDESITSWECPDCDIPADGNERPQVIAINASTTDLLILIKEIETNPSLTDDQKAKQKQEVMGGKQQLEGDRDDDDCGDIMELLGANFKCSFCMRLPERPVTTPCGHNFCLKCFQRWTVNKKKYTCVQCRSPIPDKMISNPRINSALVITIRMAKMARNPPSHEAEQGYRFTTNENRPDKAFTTERAKRAGKANACSGQIFVTIPSDFFGPITAKYDPKRNIGVRVGESYEDRMECRQWGVHFPHVAGIAGQSNYGAQSVALSGGYQDDEDHGEWFLYTGSGGRDLTGNKRTNKDQAFDQVFEKLNDALKVSCLNGYPVRVVRSHKEKRSSYAPESGVRYDGVYRIEKCWRKVGVQGFKVCRYLFIRCDNEPAPWTSDDFGDRPRSLPIIKELDDATDVIEREEPPFWDHDETTGWKWMKPPPTSKKTPPASKRLPPVRNTFKETKVIKCSQIISLTKKLLNELCCEICNEVMQSPVTTPCAHNFCKACLLSSYTDLSFSMDRSCGGRTLRSKKPVNNCPICPTNITDFLENPQVNREMMVMIESLQKKSQEIDSTSSDVETVSHADVETVSASDVETISMAIKKQKINEAGDVTIVGADGVAIVEADDAETVEEKKVGDIEAVSEIISA